MSNQEKKSNKKLLIPLLLLSLLLVIGGVAALIIVNPWKANTVDPGEFHSKASTELPSPPTAETIPTLAPETAAPVSTETEVPTTTEAPLPENPVDFASLQEINPDIYAWIYMPLSPDREDIDYPILQARTEDDDNFYLHMDMYRNYLFMGSLYTQKKNAKDFTDRMTVIYGHNMLNQVMFSNLVYFRDSQFFENHEYFYIYTPGHILTYRIAAAIQFDTRHLLNCFDFSDDKIFSEWIQNYILEPRTMVRSVREGMEVTIEDKIVVLSTCIEYGAYRYLVQGVLISDEPTQ